MEDSRQAMFSENQNPATRTDEGLTPTECRIAGLWSEYLATSDPIRSTDNFFALGGDSLAMTILLFRIKEELGVDLPPSALLEAPELRAFCALYDLHARGEVHSCPPSSAR